MFQSKKKFTIIGNWKMNPDTIEEAKSIFSAISRQATKNSKVMVVIAPPAPFIPVLSGKKIHISAQDVAGEPHGAYTGSVGARQMRSAGAEYVIIGHSERRAAGDDDKIIAKKIAESLSAGLRVILCIGEKERDNHAHYLHEVREQIIGALSRQDKKKIQWITIAYEPVWEIGQSFDLALAPALIHEMAIYIKKSAAEIFGKKQALRLPVLYGGSLNSENATAILRDACVDGLLVGRQSLDPLAFGKIIEYANNLS
ncbi:MAG: triose-phosphate isomerase [bacterium]|nr:triose-phosphate isomerase [bacterium]